MSQDTPSAPLSPSPPTDDGWFLPAETRAQLTKLFDTLNRPVRLELFTKAGVNETWSDFCRKFLGDLARLSAKIELQLHDMASPRALELGMDHAPEILLSSGPCSIRFTGSPAGEESRVFLQAIMLASTGRSSLAPTSKALLAELNEPRQVLVFVSPTCPYCPGQVINAIRCAVELPAMVRVRTIDIGENPDLAEAYGVTSVPHTIYSRPGAAPGADDSLAVLGLEPEGHFVAQLATLTSAQDLSTTIAEEETIKDSAPQAVDVVVVGAGPAGLTAAIYAARAGLKAVVLDKQAIGGQVSITPAVENWPGQKNVAGAALAEMMTEHARQYASVLDFQDVVEVRLPTDSLGVFTVRTAVGRGYTCRGVILAMGSRWRQLGVPGEDAFVGRGVSSCASCDGYFYRGKRVVVVGGGNTALTDALHLKHLGVGVTLIHRRDSFRGEKELQAAIAREGIETIWNTEVIAVNGHDGVMSGVKVRDTKTGAERDMNVDGMFLAVGQQANSELATAMGIKTDADGFILTDPLGRTNVPRVYAAGDITGGVRQIVTAVGKGATAALALQEDLTKLGA